MYPQIWDKVTFGKQRQRGKSESVFKNIGTLDDLVPDYSRPIKKAKRKVRFNPFMVDNNKQRKTKRNEQAMNVYVLPSCPSMKLLNYSRGLLKLHIS